MASWLQLPSGPQVFSPAYIRTGGEGSDLWMTVAGVKYWEVTVPISSSLSESMIKCPAIELISPTVGKATMSIESERSTSLYSIKVMSSTICIKTVECRWYYLNVI